MRYYVFVNFWLHRLDTPAESTLQPMSICRIRAEVEAQGFGNAREAAVRLGEQLVNGEYGHDMHGRYIWKHKVLSVTEIPFEPKAVIDFTNIAIAKP
jgi:hypothetical protein